MLLDPSLSGRQTTIRLLEKQLMATPINSPQFMDLVVEFRDKKAEFVVEKKKALDALKSE